MDLKQYLKEDFSLVIDYINTIDLDIEGEILIFKEDNTFFNKSQNLQGKYEIDFSNQRIFLQTPFEEYFIKFNSFFDKDKQIFLISKEDKQKAKRIFTTCKYYSYEIDDFFKLFNNQYNFIEEKMIFDLKLINKNAIIEFQKNNKATAIFETEIGGKEIVDFNWKLLRENNILKIYNKKVEYYCKFLNTKNRELLLIDTLTHYLKYDIYFFNLYSFTYNFKNNKKTIKK